MPNPSVEDGSKTGSNPVLTTQLKTKTEWLSVYVTLCLRGFDSLKSGSSMVSGSVIGVAVCRFESCPDYDPFGRLNQKWLAKGRDTDAPNGRINPASGPWRVFGVREDVTDDSSERRVKWSGRSTRRMVKWGVNPTSGFESCTDHKDWSN